MALSPFHLTQIRSQIPACLRQVRQQRPKKLCGPSSSKILLNAMLEQLGLPEPIYHQRTNYHSEVYVTAVFFPSSSRLRNPSGQVSLSGNPSDKVETAQENAATKAIRYLETSIGNPLRDYNYDKMKATQEHNKSLLQSVKEKDQTINELSRGWDDTLKDMNATCQRIQQITADSFSPGSSALDGELNMTLLQIEEAVRCLEYLGLQSEEQLQTVGVYPYNTDAESAEDESLSAFDYSNAMQQPDGRSYLDDESIYDENE